MNKVKKVIINFIFFILKKYKNKHARFSQFNFHNVILDWFYNIYKNAIENAPELFFVYFAIIRGFAELLMTSSCL